MQQYDFSLCDPKSNKICNCVRAERVIYHHGSWRQSTQQDRRCEVASRETGRCLWPAYRPLISWHSDVNSCPQDVCLGWQVSHVTFRLHILRRVYKRPYSIAAIFNMSPRHASVDTCMQFPCFYSTRTIKATSQKSSRHSTRLKGLSTVIITISKEAAACHCSLFAGIYNFRCLKMQVSPVNSVMHPEDWKKRGWVICQSFRGGLWFKGPGQSTGVETKRPGSRVFSWRASQGSRKHQIVPFPLYLRLPVTIRLNIIVHLCT